MGKQMVDVDMLSLIFRANSGYEKVAVLMAFMDNKKISYGVYSNKQL